MKSFLTSASVIALTGLLLTAPAAAQQPGPKTDKASAENRSRSGPGDGWGSGMMMGPGMMGWGGRVGFAHMCDPRGAGLAEWSVERVDRPINLTEAQRVALNDLRTASVKAAEIIAAACPRDLPASASARLDLMEKRMVSMLQAIKTVRPAFDAFYATLNDEQKARINTGGPRHWGWRGWRG